MADPDELEVTKRRQALVTLDKIEESLEASDYGDAADATLRLSQHVGELQGIDNV